MSNWPFTFEAEMEMEEETRRRRWPVRRPVAPAWRRPFRFRPVLAPAAVVPVALPWLPPAPPMAPAPVEEPIEEPVAEPVESPADEPQEELYVTTGSRAILNREDAIGAGLVYDEKKTLPKGPGLYVIRKSGRAIYVGIAENSIHTRFLQRYKSLRDFGMDSSVLDGVTVTTYELVSRNPGLVAVRSAAAAKKGTRVNAKEGILRILEQAFIKHFGTEKKAGAKFGNTGSERYAFAPGEKIILVINNRASTDPPSPIE